MNYHVLKYFISFGLGIATYAFMQLAQAQMSPDVAAQIKAMGRVVSPSATAAIYAPRQLDKEPYVDVAVERDIAYGTDPRNLLDVFAPKSESTIPRKVLMFVHGGAFSMGNRRSSPSSPFYDNVMLWAVKNNMIGVNLTYRLAPKYTWLAVQTDIGAAVHWVNANIAAYRGDPKQVFLMGHSAGAAHVASYVAHEPSHGVQGSGLAGAILLSGIFYLSTELEDAAAVKYYGTDAMQYPERMARNGLLTTSVPLWIGYAELDPPSFELQFNAMKEALCKAGRCPAGQVFSRHSHMSEIYSFNSDDTEVSNAVLTFMKSPRYQLKKL